MDWISTPGLLALLGFAGGMVLGLAARLGRFCTLGAIEDLVLLNDSRRIRAWILAIAVAIAGTQAMSLAEWIDPVQSIYLGQRINIPAAIVGGLMFGMGMALTGTCGYGALARIGGGDLRALVMVLVMGISAYAAIGGITALGRVRIFEPLSIDLGRPQSIAGILGGGMGSNGPYLVAFAIAAVLVGLVLRDRAFRQSRRLIVAGVSVGLAVCWGWIATGVIAADPFQPRPLESYTFVRPLGDTLIYLMTFSGSSIKFGIGASFGVIAGALLGALTQGKLRWEACDDPRELRRQIFGAFLMGTGGVLALGCTIGQGVSAASVLAVSAPIVLGSIFLGAWLGISWLVEGSSLASIFGVIGKTGRNRAVEPRD